MEDFFSDLAAITNLAVFYGYLIDIQDKKPRFNLSYVRFFDESKYATNLFSYDVKRDANGIVILDNNGLPKLSNFKVLQYAKSGRNQNKSKK